MSEERWEFTISSRLYYWDRELNKYVLLHVACELEDILIESQFINYEIERELELGRIAPADATQVEEWIPEEESEETGYKCVTFTSEIPRRLKRVSNFYVCPE